MLLKFIWLPWIECKELSYNKQVVVRQLIVFIEVFCLALYRGGWVLSLAAGDAERERALRKNAEEAARQQQAAALAAEGAMRGVERALRDLDEQKKVDPTTLSGSNSVSFFSALFFAFSWTSGPISFSRLRIVSSCPWSSSAKFLISVFEFKLLD